MAISQEFSKAVDEKKYTKIKIILKDSMLVDPTMKQFDELLAYATEHLGNLYEEHDGENLEYDTTLWNETYLNRQMVIVVSNFSKERVGLLKNMVRYLYRERIEDIEKERNKTTYSSQNNISQKNVGIGVTAVGTVAAITGIVASEGILIVGGAVVAAAGVAMILTDKEM